ncbi:MAG TPA: GDSL-type esterase/lipase family protein [Lacunisphaera sp.]|nr:GDSL-type esterase/lipase family protein [Lacunisphaera sp.]
MKPPLRSLLPLCCFLAAVAGLSGQAAAPAAPAPVDASAAAPKTGNKRFFQLHESFLKRAKEGPIGVLFLGDSITEGWTKAPHIWDHFYARYQPANFGISGDQTQHVIWRLENGELDGISPKVVVLMLGTNNTGRNTGAEIAAADRKIVEMIRHRLPATKVLLLAIFPRGPRKDSQGNVEDAAARMAVIRAANAELATLDDGKNVRFLDLNARFLADDGSIPHIIMPDQLHPDAAGYELWAEAMQPLLDQMMQ